MEWRVSVSLLDTLLSVGWLAVDVTKKKEEEGKNPCCDCKIVKKEKRRGEIENREPRKFMLISAIKIIIPVHDNVQPRM